MKQEFKCPDCGLNCLVQQTPGKPASMQHQIPECETYRRTKRDGQKFLELAFIARPGAAALSIGLKS